MHSYEIEKRLATILSLGALSITLLITDRVSADPVNIGKLVATATFSGCCFIILIQMRAQIASYFKVPVYLMIGFLSISLVSIILSKNPIEKGFYGTYGRNTGFLAYLGFVLLFLAGTQISRNENYLRIFRVLFLAGFINVVYCCIFLTGYDVFTWQNPYGKVLGTFGNPNFISSFMGIVATALFTLFISPKFKLKERAILLMNLVLSLWVIISSGSQQGLVVAFGGFAIVLLFLIRSLARQFIVVVLYTAFVGVSGLLSVLGMLQFGPLTGLLYKQSVSLRGEYWQAGFNMALDNFWFGVGMDSYGTFYRTYREASAIVLPGINVVSDAAHNIFIDVFAGTGFFGIVCYVSLIGLIFKESFVFIRKHRDFDPYFVLLFSTWCAYQAQSIISINQIGLAIWGWLLGGLLLGYTKRQNLMVNPKTNIQFAEIFRFKKKEKSKEVSAGIALGTFLGGLIFLAISIPAFFADVSLRQAIKLNSQENFMKVFRQFPMDSNRINFIGSRISQEEINEQVLTLVNEGLNKFPYDYGLLFSKFQVSEPNSEEWKEIGKRLHDADPLNPAYFEFK